MINIPASIRIPEHYFLKTADIIIERKNSIARAIDRYGNLLHDSSELADVFNVAKAKCGDRCTIVLTGTHHVKQPLVIDRSDIALIGLSAKLIADASMDYMILIDGKTKNPYRVLVAGLFLDLNNLAKSGVTGYSAVNRAPIDSMVIGNTIVNSAGGGVTGYFYNTLIARNVVNYSDGAAFNIAGGQHVTLFDNTTYMNKGPSLILGLTDTAYVIRHKSLTDGISNTFWRCAIALNGLKTHVLQDFEIWTSNSDALYYTIRVWPKNQDEYYTAIIRDGMIRDEGSINHQMYVRFEAYSDKHVAVIDNVDARQADAHYAYSFQIVNGAGKLITRNFMTSLSPVVAYLARWIELPHRFLSDCNNMPGAGIEPGQSIVCYDSTAAKWVIKVWDGSAWQTIG